MEKDTSPNLTRLKNTIGKSTGEIAKIIAVPTELIHFTGKTQKGVFLAQLVYWSDKGSRPDGYIFKSRREWTSETGLSESQIESFTKQFRNAGFLDTKLKRANGNPTIHYKLDIEKFLDTFSTFLSNRYPEIQEMESEESEESLTDSTSDNTHILLEESETLSSLIKTESKESTYVKEEVIDNVAKSNNEQSREKKIELPADFIPDRWALFRATITFPTKSPSHVTLKFIEYHRSKRLKGTASDWQNRWWNWMSREWESLGNPKLEDEHWEIQRDLLRDIFKITSKVKHGIFDIEHIDVTLEGSVPIDVLQMVLDKLTGRGDLREADGNYYLSQRFDTDSEYQESIRDDLEYLDLPVPNGS